MRIALLSWESLHSVAVGGVAAHVSELSAALERKGQEVHVFTRRAPGQRSYDKIENVHYHRSTYPRHNDFVDDVNNMCRAFVDKFFDVEDFVGHFDVVHAHDWLCGNAMIWIKQGRGHKCMFTMHATEYARCGNTFHNGRSLRIRDQERASTYWADRIVAVSHATKGEIAWMYEVPDWKTTVVYNGVCPHRFHGEVDQGAIKHQYRIGPLDPTVLFCGRLTFQKGPDLLVEAIPSVLKAQPRAKFVFAGDGDMRGRLETRCRQLGVADSVRFLGYRSGDELVNLFKMSDVVCVPSRNEPFGIVVLEAWSAGKPVVVTQNGGPNEYVQHDLNGLKIYPRVDSVAWGLGTLFSNFDRARWMGDNGRRIVHEQFTWDTIAEQTLSVYDPQWRQQAEAAAAAQAAAQAAAEQAEAQRLQAAAQQAPEPSLQGTLALAELQSLMRASGGPNVSVEISAGWTPRVLAGWRAIEVCETVLTDCGFTVRLDNETVRIDGTWEEVFTAVRRCFEAVGIEGEVPLSIKVRRCGTVASPPMGWKGTWLGPLFAAPASRRPRRAPQIAFRVGSGNAVACAAVSSQGGGNGDR